MAVIDTLTHHPLYTAKCGLIIYLFQGHVGTIQTRSSFFLTYFHCRCCMHYIYKQFRGSVQARGTCYRQVILPQNLSLQPNNPAWQLGRVPQVWAGGDGSGREAAEEAKGEKGTPDTSGPIPFQGSSPNSPSGLMLRGAL